LWAQRHGHAGGRVPRVDAGVGRACFAGLHMAIGRGLVRSCHDLSEGGLAVALAEMALAGGLGARGALSDIPRAADAACDYALLFSESPSRVVLEVRPEHRGELAEALGGLPLAWIGEVTSVENSKELSSERLRVRGLDGDLVIDARTSQLNAAWQRPLRW